MEKEKKDYAKICGQLVGFSIVRIMGTIFLWLSLNAVFREFNLPEFSFWVYLGLNFGWRYALHSVSRKED